MTEYRLDILRGKKGESKILVHSIPLKRVLTEKESNFLRTMIATLYVDKIGPTESKLEEEVKSILTSLDIIERSFDVEEIIIEQEVDRLKGLYTKYKNE